MKSFKKRTSTHVSASQYASEAVFHHTANKRIKSKREIQSDIGKSKRTTVFGKVLVSLPG